MLGKLEVSLSANSVSSRPVPLSSMEESGGMGAQVEAAGSYNPLTTEWRVQVEVLQPQKQHGSSWQKFLPAETWESNSHISSTVCKILFSFYFL